MTVKTTTTNDNAASTSIAELPPCPCDITLADGVTKARIFSWTDGSTQAPIIGFYERDGYGAVPATWRADGSLHDGELSCERASLQGFRIAELPETVVAFHRARIAEQERKSDPMQSLVQQLRTAFEEHSPVGSGGMHLGQRSRVIELESEDGTEQSAVVVSRAETPESLAAQYGHRIISAGYLYRTHMRDGTRDKLAASAGAKWRPSVTLSRRERKAAKDEAIRRKTAKAIEAA